MSHYCLGDKRKKAGAIIRRWGGANQNIIDQFNSHPLTADIQGIPGLGKHLDVLVVETYYKKAKSLIVGASYSLNVEGSKVVKVYLEIPYDPGIVCEGK